MRADARTASTAAALVVAALSLLGCVEPYEDPPITWEGEIIRFGADDPEAVCGDTLTWMDTRALALAEVFTAAGAEVYPQVDFYWLPESWAEQDECSVEEAVGCASDNVVRSQSVPHEHELVHALRPNRLPRVFEEGLAEVYGNLSNIYIPVSRERLLEMLEAGEAIDRQDYSRAGHFVAFLIERHGLETLLAMAEEDVGYGADWEQTQAAFFSAYGFPLQDALAEYEDQPECAPPAWKNIDIACAREPVLVDPPHGSGDVRLRKDLACGEPGVYGPLEGKVFSETTIELENDVGGGLYVRMLGDEVPGAEFVLAQCGGCGDAAWVWLGEGVPERLLLLPTGRYVMRMIRPVDDPGELEVSIGYFK